MQKLKKKKKTKEKKKKIERKLDAKQTEIGLWTKRYIHAYYYNNCRYQAHQQQAN